MAAEVTSVIDGDKLRVSVDGDAAEVLLIGVDAPEPTGENGEPECYAAEATERLIELTPVGTTVYLEAQDGTDRDGKDRLLRHVWVLGADGAKPYLLNTKLVREGYAGFDARHAGGGRYRERLEQGERDAQDKERGLWGTCGGLHTLVPVAGGGFGTSLDAFNAQWGEGEEWGRGGFQYEIEGATLFVSPTNGRVSRIVVSVDEALSIEAIRTFVTAFYPADVQFVETRSNATSGLPQDVLVSDAIAALGWGGFNTPGEVLVNYRGNGSTGHYTEADIFANTY